MPELKLVNDNIKRPISDEDMKKLQKLLDDVRFGSVTLVIQDGRVVQMEKNEKMRLK